MTFRKKIISTFILTGTFIVPEIALAQSTKIGINSAVKGRVTIQSGEEEAMQAKLTEPVFLQDEVNSSKSSSLQVLLMDETTFTVGPDCSLTIDKFVYNPASTTNNLTASVKKGMFRFMSGNISRTNTNGVNIDSPVASLGVRGTIVEGLVGEEAIEIARRAGSLPSGAMDKDGASIFILRGPGPNTQAGARRGAIDVTSGGKTVTVNQSGYATFVGSNSAQPTDPFLIPDSVHEYFSKRLRTKPKSNVDIDPIEFEHIDPLTDMDWPGEHNDNFPFEFDEIIPPSDG